MKSKNNETILMLAIVFAIIGGIMLAYGLTEPIVYEKEETSQAEIQSTIAQEQSSIVTSKAVVKTQNATTKPNETTMQISYPVNLNTATFEELVSIPKVGEARAYAILDYRTQLGGYSSVDQIKNIYGIGDKLYSEIAGYLTV